MLSKNQKDEIIKMYAELISTQESAYERLKQLEKLRDSFGALIPDWQKMISDYANRHGLGTVLSTVALLASKPEEDTELPPRDIINAGIARKCKYGYYTTKTDEEIDAEQKEYYDRLINYTAIMTIVDKMYDREIITLDEYYKVQDMMSEKYGFTQQSLFWWDGPHKKEPLPPQPPKKSKPYTKRNTEYWSKYKK